MKITLIEMVTKHAGVTVSNTGEIVVVDNKASNIYVMQTNGKILRRFNVL